MSGKHYTEYDEKAEQKIEGDFLGLALIDELEEEEPDLEKISKCLADKNTNVNVVSANRMCQTQLPVHYYKCNGSFNIGILEDFFVNPLYLAANFGNIGLVTALLERKAAVNSKMHTCAKAINIAALKGYVEIVKILLKVGAHIGPQPQQTGIHSYSTIHFAAFGGNLELVKLLVETHKADVNAESHSKNTPLIAAARSGHLVVAQYLLSKGAILNHQNEEGFTAFHAAVVTSHKPDTYTGLQMLRRMQSDNLDTILKRSKERQDRMVSVINFFLEKKADVNLKNNDGETAIFSAISLSSESESKLVIVELLLKAGASLDVKNMESQTVFDVLNDITELPDPTEVMKIKKGLMSKLEIAAIQHKREINNLLVGKQMFTIVWNCTDGYTKMQQERVAQANVSIETQEDIQILPAEPTGQECLVAQAPSVQDKPFIADFVKSSFFDVHLLSLVRQHLYAKKYETMVVKPIVENLEDDKKLKLR